jgi:hypothetical protein
MAIAMVIAIAIAIAMAMAMAIASNLVHVLSNYTVAFLSSE